MGITGMQAVEGEVFGAGIVQNVVEGSYYRGEVPEGEYGVRG